MTPPPVPRFDRVGYNECGPGLGERVTAWLSGLCCGVTLLTWSGCTHSSDEIAINDTEASVTADPGDDEITNVTWSESEHIPTVIHVTWDSSVTGEGHLEYGLDGQLDLVTPATSSDTSFSVPMLGLKAGHSYSFRPIITGDDSVQYEGGLYTVDIAPPPQGLARVTISDYDPLQTMPGGFFLYSYIQVDEGYTVIIDRDGDYVWWYPGSDNVGQYTIERGRDHYSVVWSQYDKSQRSDIGGVVQVALDGTSFDLTRSVYGHHDFAELPNGDLAMLAYLFEDIPFGNPPVLTHVATDQIAEVPRGATEKTPLDKKYSYFDNYPPTPWLVCPHGEIVVDFPGEGPTQEYTHTNSLLYDEEDDAFYIMPKYMDAFLKVDRATGEVLWQLGGIYSAFSTPPGDHSWNHGHFSHLWDDGFAVFNNCDHCEEPKISSVQEYTFDEEARTYEKVWEYTDPEGRHMELLGDVKKLPNGNYIVSWTEAGMLTEITPDQDVVWRLEADLGAATTRVSWFGDIYTME